MAADVPDSDGPDGDAPPAVVVHEVVSPHNHIVVVDEGPWRMMRFGGPIGDEQSGYLRDNPQHLAFEYTRIIVAVAARHLAARGARALLVGVGGGSLLTHWSAHAPAAIVTGIELDSEVVVVARSWFPWTSSPRHFVVVADAHRALPEDPHRYDVIVLDAFASQGIPDVLVSDEFYRHVAQHLTDTGVVIVNVALMTLQPREWVVQRLLATFPIAIVIEGVRDENWIVVLGPGAVLSAIHASLDDVNAAFPTGAHTHVKTVREVFKTALDG
jgi:spermidine synthase